MAAQGLSLQKKLAFSALMTFGFLLLGELAVRGWVYYLREEYTRYETTTGMPYLIPGEHGRSDDPVVVNSDGFVGHEFEDDAPDLIRVVALGDSNTFGHGSVNIAYPAVLGRLLDKREAPGRRYEVINAGIEGMDSREALYRLRQKVVDLGPEIVVIYIGWNDLMKYDPLGQEGVSPAASASRFLDRLWLVKGIRKFVFVYARPRFDPPKTGPESRTGRFADFRPGNYIDNVRTIIREVREAGAKPVLMNLTSVVRETDTAEDLVRAQVFFPYYPNGYAVGDFLDLQYAYNRAVEEIAEADEVPMVDLHEIFLRRPDYRQLFLDTMHPTKTGYEIVAENIVRVLDDSKMIAP